MEISGYAIAFVALVWGAVEIVKHFLPGWEMEEREKSRVHYSTTHYNGIDRLDLLEERIQALEHPAPPSSAA